MEKKGRLSFNSTIDETIKCNKSRIKMILLTYLVYVFITIIVFYYIKERNITRVLLADFIAVFACVLFIVYFGKRTFNSLGMSKGIIKNYLVGWIIATAILYIIWQINVSIGSINSSLNKDVNYIILSFLFIGFIFQGFFEEFLFRGLLFTEMAIKRGVVYATILNSVLFAFSHTGNLNSSLISFVNTFLLSIVFSLMYYYHDNIWIVAAFHSGWNFMLGPFFGINVSGFNLPTVVLNSLSIPNNEAFNGGLYGLEASYFVTIAFILITLIYSFLILKKVNISTLRD